MASSGFFSKKSSTNQHDERVVLLLDLDCFYAQCECLRLGFESDKTSLALLQWNSVLAVTYPAREKFGVKRGVHTVIGAPQHYYSVVVSFSDSWQEIRNKVAKAKSASQESNVSGGGQIHDVDTCHAIHVPLLTTASVLASAETSAETGASASTSTTTTTASQSNAKINNPYLRTTKAVKSPTTSSQNPPPEQPPLRKKPPTLEEEYASIFQMSHDEQQRCRQKELGVRRLSHEGKASIERYRIASARIFQTVHAFLQKSSAIIERASIDEFYLDVTATVNSDNDELCSEMLVSAAKAETKLVGVEESARDIAMGRHHGGCLDTFDESADRQQEEDLYWRGAAIALAIRRHVYATLGFTLTAGVGTNKTMAKLSASYGKPNGQASCPPSSIPWLLNDTPLRKCRNLGGKFGEKVEKLLMQDQSATQPFMVASVARHLSLPTLARSLGQESAQWLFQLSAYGIESEPVAPKIQHENASESSTSTTKSLTAFKALPNSRSGSTHSIEEASPWFRLLATDLITRVQRDTERNKRAPRTCTLHYTKPTGDRGKTQTKSVRVAFPTQSQQPTEMVNALCLLAASTLKKKEGASLQLTRIGFCATDFVQQNTRQSINRFFAVGPKSDSGGPDKASHKAQQKTQSSPSKDSFDQDEKRKGLVLEYKGVASSQTHGMDENTVNSNRDAANDDDDSDLILAKQLQAKYDREDQVWGRLEQRPQKRHKKRRQTIEKFFASK